MPMMHAARAARKRPILRLADAFALAWRARNVSSVRQLELSTVNTTVNTHRVGTSAPSMSVSTSQPTAPTPKAPCPCHRQLLVGPCRPRPRLPGPRPSSPHRAPTHRSPILPMRHPMRMPHAYAHAPMPTPHPIRTALGRALCI